MAFKQIIPRARSASGDIKVSFTGSKTVYANVYISFDLLNRLGWEKDCRVLVYFDDEMPKRWMIEHSLDGDKSSFKVISNKNKMTKISKLQFKFDECKLNEEDKRIKQVPFEIIDNKIIINGE
ncbi:MAG: hypothetical protein LRY67_07115 [Gammaproteobacteria bacterium]|nr:hypothetical protein [Gammaproteobacteria bacterium]MCD8543229.1 hypothetical protein [Gammaproteobacteria bacterium]